MAEATPVVAVVRGSTQYDAKVYINNVEVLNVASVEMGRSMDGLAMMTLTILPDVIDMQMVSPLAQRLQAEAKAQQEQDNPQPDAVPVSTVTSVLSDEAEIEETQ